MKRCCLKSALFPIINCVKHYTIVRMVKPLFCFLKHFCRKIYIIDASVGWVRLGIKLCLCLVNLVLLGVLIYINPNFHLFSCSRNWVVDTTFHLIYTRKIPRFYTPIKCLFQLVNSVSLVPHNVPIKTCRLTQYTSKYFG